MSWTGIITSLSHLARFHASVKVSVISRQLMEMSGMNKYGELKGDGYGGQVVEAANQTSSVKRRTTELLMSSGFPLNALGNSCQVGLCRCLMHLDLVSTAGFLVLTTLSGFGSQRQLLLSQRAIEQLPREGWIIPLKLRSNAL